MALVPAANGVDALVGGLGIGVADIGQNVFAVALNVTSSVDGFVAGELDSPVPLGITINSIPGSTINAASSGCVLVTGIYLTSNTVGAGPQDQITVRLVDVDTGSARAEVHLVPYQNLATPTQLGTATSTAFLDAGHNYRLDVTTVNISGNLDLGATGQVGAMIVPLMGGVTIVAPGLAAHANI